MIKKISIIIFFLFSVISFSKEYNRIASGSPAITEILYELGLKDKIIAMDKNSDIKELDDMKIPKVSFYHMNTESIFSFIFIFYFYLLFLSVNYFFLAIVSF